MWRRPAIRNSVRASVRPALIVDRDRAKRGSLVNPVSRENLANREAANGLLPAVWIVATVAQVNVVRATAALATLIARNGVAANASRADVAAIVRNVVEIAANVLRCGNERRWIATVDRAKIAASPVGLRTGIVDRGRQIAIAGLRRVKIAAARATLIVRAKATVVLVTTIVLLPAAAVTATMIGRQPAAANATSTSAIATAITLRAAKKCAIFLRAGVIRDAADAADDKREITLHEAGFGPPFLLSRFGDLLRNEQRANRHRVFTQAGQGNRRRGMKCFHDEMAKGCSHAGAQRFAEERKSAAENNDLRMTKVHNVRKSEGEIFAGFAQNALGARIVLAQRGGEMSSFAALHAATELRELAIRAFDRFANPTIHRPP